MPQIRLSSKTQIPTPENRNSGNEDANGVSAAELQVFVRKKRVQKAVEIAAEEVIAEENEQPKIVCTPLRPHCGTCTISNFCPSAFKEGSSPASTLKKACSK